MSMRLIITNNIKPFSDTTPPNITYLLLNWCQHALSIYLILDYISIALSYKKMLVWLSLTISTQMCISMYELKSLSVAKFHSRYYSFDNNNLGTNMSLLNYIFTLT